MLRSLVEPPPPVFEEPPPVRRGRKPGSKNRPKPQLDAGVPSPEAERPRRGRKPGSKNKPKPQVPTAFPPVLAASQQSLAAAMRSYGFADDGTVWTAPKEPAGQSPQPAAAPTAAPAASAPTVPPAAAPSDVEPSDAEPTVQARARSRVRLRDRSSILKRYVLDIEPRPGQPGAIRARRLARAV